MSYRESLPEARAHEAGRKQAGHLFRLYFAVGHLYFALARLFFGRAMPTAAPVGWPIVSSDETGPVDSPVFTAIIPLT